MTDKLGSAWLAERLTAADLVVPRLLAEAAGKSFYRFEGGKRQFLGTDGAYHDIVRAPGVLLLEDIKLRSKAVLRNSSAALWDIGDGVACFEFTSKCQCASTTRSSSFSASRSTLSDRNSRL